MNKSLMKNLEIMKLGAFLLAGINADLYNHGKSEGDTVMNMDGNGISKVPLSSTANIFNVNKDVLWFSNSGAISFNALDDNNLESLKESDRFIFRIKKLVLGCHAGNSENYYKLDKNYNITFILIVKLSLEYIFSI